jgi:phage baseplate assembly protein W
MNIDFPVRIGADGRTATATDADHVREMIELLLFTQPGERVMQPQLGAGLIQYLFAPNSGQLATAVHASVAAALNMWLGDLIDVQGLDLQSNEATLSVTVSYVLRATGQAQTATLERGQA